MDEQTSDVGFPAFARYIEHEHQLLGNVARGSGRQFTGMALHAKNTEGWSGIAHPFSHGFTRFLDDGLATAAIERDWDLKRARWELVEEAIRWLGKRDNRLEMVVRHYTEPRHIRSLSVLQLAGVIGMSEDGPARLMRRAIRSLWWYVGERW